jgi:tRNA G18 (ribose-2'-O)-methylase SpoU
MPKIALIAHNIRSANNIGSLMRTAEGLGIHIMYITGYSPYPESNTDGRPPHIRRRVSVKIKKTSLGAEKTIKWKHSKEIEPVINRLKMQKYIVAALEQTKTSKDLSNFKNQTDIALIVGNEVTGIDREVLQKADICLEIPMAGNKESFNVAEAAAMALYHLKFTE